MKGDWNVYKTVQMYWKFEFFLRVCGVIFFCNVLNETPQCMKNECCVSNCAAKTGNTTVDISERMVCLLTVQIQEKQNVQQETAIPCVHCIVCTSYLYSLICIPFDTHTHAESPRQASKHASRFVWNADGSCFCAIYYAYICSDLFSTTGFYVSAARMKFFYFTLNKQLQKFIQPNFVRSTECMKDYNCLRTMQQPNDNNIHIWHVYIHTCHSSFSGFRPFMLSIKILFQWVHCFIF